MDRRAGDPARLADAGGGHHVGLDRRLQPLDVEVLLEAADDLDQAALVDDRRHLFVVRQPAGDVSVEPVLRPLTDPDDRGADLAESPHELLLVVGKARLEKDDVHATAHARSRHPTRTLGPLDPRRDQTVFTMKTSHGAWCAMWFATLPRSRPAPFMRTLPKKMIDASNCMAASRITRSGFPADATPDASMP